MPRIEDHRISNAQSAASRAAAVRSVVIDPKHRRNVLQKYRALNRDFAMKRKSIYQQQIQILNTKLQALIRGDDPGFLEELVDVEESRDEELVRLNTHQKYLLDQAQAEHQQRLAMVDNQFQQATKIILDKFEQKLQTHVNGNGNLRSRASSSFDIAADSATELKISTARSKRGAAALGGPGGHRPKLRRREVTSSYATNYNTGSGSESAMNSAFELGRLRLPRDKDFEEDLKFFWSDIDLTTYSGNESATPVTAASTSAARSSRSVKGLNGLNSGEIALDLDLMRQRYS